MDKNKKINKGLEVFVYFITVITICFIFFIMSKLNISNKISFGLGVYCGMYIIIYVRKLKRWIKKKKNEKYVEEFII